MLVLLTYTSHFLFMQNFKCILDMTKINYKVQLFLFFNLKEYL